VIAMRVQASTQEERSTEDHVRCDFVRLIEYLERRLGADGELEVLEHLERCEVCFDTICELVRERAAFRALRSCPEVRIAAMKRADACHADSARTTATQEEGGFAQGLQPDRTPAAKRLNVASRACIRKGRRWARWG
jgi:hypothetical protein